MEELIDKFIREILAQKDMKGVDPEVIEQLVADMSQRIKDQINRAIINQLTEEQLKEFENMLSKQTDDTALQKFLDSAGVDTAKTAAEVMKAFRTGYLGH